MSNSATLTKREIWDHNVWDNELTWGTTYALDYRKMMLSHHSWVVRKAYIKRKQLSDGQFESDWYEITDHVKKWGQVRWSIDAQRYGKFQFHNLKMKVSNVEGKFNPNDNSYSLWDGYADQQRSLVKIECGFEERLKLDDGYRYKETYPTNTAVFVGIISGDLGVSGKNEVDLNIKPLTQVFKDYPALELRGFSATGITASRFIEILRDHTDGSSNYIFRPFFHNTSSYWSINSTDIVYENLNTGSASDLQQRDCWDVVEKLAQSENHAAYIDNTGVFKWVPKSVGASSTFHFVGLQYLPNRAWGHTIKNIARYGKKLTQFYSRVSVHWQDTLSSDAYASTGLSFAITGSNTAWNLGHRTFAIENYWIPNATVAGSIASSVFSDISSLSNEINFETSLVTAVDILDKIEVSYDASDQTSKSSLWDLNDWTTQLEWDATRGDAIVLDEQEFKVLSVDINLDTLSTRFIAKQI